MGEEPFKSHLLSPSLSLAIEELTIEEEKTHSCIPVFKPHSAYSSKPIAYSSMEVITLSYLGGL